MEIQKDIIDRKGQKLHLTYTDVDVDENFLDLNVAGGRAYCFYKDKLVVVNEPAKGGWVIPGGGIEKGESALEGITREVKEESNMKVLKHRFIGLLKADFPNEAAFYTTSVCIVEPYGDFVSDPDNDITERKFVDPEECSKYIDPNLEEIKDRIVERVIEMKRALEPLIASDFVDK